MMNLDPLITATLATSLIVCFALWQKVKKQNNNIKMLSQTVLESRQLLDKMPNKIIRYNADCVRTYVSLGGNYLKIWNAEYLLGKKPSEFPGGENSIVFEESIKKIFVSKKNTAINLELNDPNGEARVTHFELFPEFDEKDNVISVLGIGQDITEIVKNHHRIYEITSFDQLTNLPNRIFLLQQMKMLMTDKSNATQKFALIHFDLDAFKDINGFLGFTLGNQLICEVAHRLKSILKDDAILARTGGAEFTILLPNGNNQCKVTRLSKKIIQLFSTAFRVQDKDIFIATNLGIVLYPEHSTDENTLLLHADSAMNYAKKTGCNQFLFYDPAFTQALVMRTELETALRNAQKNNELMLVYQPQMGFEQSINEAKIIGAEALLRWKHPEKGMIPPDKFIPIAEDTGLIIEIGEWVLETAFLAASVWNKNAQTPIKIAVNLSSRQFKHHDLVATIKQLLKKTHCKPQWIKLEITESLLIDEAGHIMAMLIALTELGFDLSIDDFGTGYSALSYLTRYPISQIKIDRSFITDIPIDIEKCELVKVIIQIAKVLHLEVIAEGAETQEQIEFLRRTGCNFAQGYFYFKPMRAEELSQLIAPVSALEAAMTA